MKIPIRILIFFFLFILMVTGCGTGGTQPGGGYNFSADWSLVWSDEFNGVTLDNSKWTAMNRGSSYNSEQQAYLAANVSVADGCLVLTSKLEEWTGPDNFNPGSNVTRHYTSGLVDTRNKAYWTYGRFEVCAQLPKTQGIWPAHWLLPNDGDWPPEIDIMELLGHEPNKVYCTNHWGVYPEHYSNGSGAIAGLDYSTGFHVFAVEWEPDSIRWYIDSTKVFESNQGVPSEPFYLILNTAVGGGWPGNPDSTTVFPQYHKIDWVRVYQKD